MAHPLPVLVPVLVLVLALALALVLVLVLVLAQERLLQAQIQGSVVVYTVKHSLVDALV
jgi:hypothetical protein